MINGKVLVKCESLDSEFFLLITNDILELYGIKNYIKLFLSKMSMCKLNVLLQDIIFDLDKIEEIQNLYKTYDFNMNEHNILLAQCNLMILYNESRALDFFTQASYELEKIKLTKIMNKSLSYTFSYSQIKYSAYSNQVLSENKRIREGLIKICYTIKNKEFIVYVSRALSTFIEDMFNLSKFKLAVREQFIIDIIGYHLNKITNEKLNYVKCVHSHILSSDCIKFDVVTNNLNVGDFWCTNLDLIKENEFLLHDEVVASHNLLLNTNIEYQFPLRIGTSHLTLAQICQLAVNDIVMLDESFTGFEDLVNLEIAGNKYKVNIKP